MSSYTLHLGDCLEYMRTMDAGSVDAVITDPPYGISYSPSQNSAKAWGLKTFAGDVVVSGDNVKFNPSPFINFGSVVLFGANHYADRLPASSAWVVWDKRDGLESNDFADCEMIWTNSDKVARVFKHRWSGALRDSERGIERVHPTQKPVILMRWLIENYTQPGDTVFDPFMGSGTTGVACMQLGRNFIGCEIDPQYFAIAERRIKDAAAQPALFTLDEPQIKIVQGGMF